jgi:phosphonate metabolism protein PhnN/1,5-bisphosphokinase (PRPP-forming)
VSPDNRRAGLFVAVVGPSGAGKDSLISGARLALADEGDVVFARRVITREPDATEDCDGCASNTFRRMVAAGEFCLWWEANGQGYGLPRGLAGDLAGGRIVVANISRGSIDEARERFGRVHVVHVTASEETLAARLAARGRETAEDQEARLRRALDKDRGLVADARIDNDGPLSEGVAHFVGVLEKLRARSA